MKYCPKYYPQYEISKYFSKYIDIIICSNKKNDIEELKRIYKILNDMIKDEISYYKHKYIKIKYIIIYILIYIGMK